MKALTEGRRKKLTGEKAVRESVEIQVGVIRAYAHFLILLEDSRDKIRSFLILFGLHFY